MVAKELAELLTTPASRSAGDIILDKVKAIKLSAELMNNAIENDRILVAGREAGRIQDAAELITALLEDK